MTERPLPRPAPPVDPVPAAGARIVMVGPPAAGKSTIGRLIAERLDIPFVDTDHRIAELYGPIPQIFAERGEDRFREYERAVVRRELRRLLERPGVVSLGGGAVLNPGTRAQLKHPAIKTIAIEIDSTTAVQRLGGSRRPLLDDSDDPGARWQGVFDERRSLYEEAATAVIQADDGPPSTAVNRIIGIITGLQRAEEYEKFRESSQEQELQ